VLTARLGKLRLVGRGALTDLDRKFLVGTDVISGLLGTDKALTLREIIDQLEKTYCGTVGIEFMHIKNRQECNWIRSQVENRDRTLSKDEQLLILDRLMWAELFETYAHTRFGAPRCVRDAYLRMVRQKVCRPHHPRFTAKKWTSEKRFGLEGAEALIPGLKSLIDYAADLGTKSIIIGMPHRGRLNVLANVVRKPAEVRGRSIRCAPCKCNGRS